VKVRVLFFRRDAGHYGSPGRVRGGAGWRARGGLIRAVCAAIPRLEAMARSLRWGVNQEFGGRERVLQDNDEVAFLPPVSGG